MSTDEVKLEVLHEVTFGAQDAALKEIGDTRQPTYEKVVEHICATLVMNPGKINYVGSRKVYEFPNRPGLAIANIRLVGDNWSCAFLMIGGQYFDRLNSVSHGSSFWITDGGRCLPFVSNHSVSIQADKYNEDDISIEYDLVEPIWDHHDICFSFEANQTSGHETIGAGVSKVRLSYNHPVKKLIVDVLKGNVDAIEFGIDKFDHMTIPFEKVSASQFVLDYGENTINFSRLHVPWIKVTAKEESVLDPRAISLHIVRVLPEAGMYGLAFSK